MPFRVRGRLIAWKPDKAFGFIRPDQGGNDVFVHQRDFGSISRAPRVGDLVYFQRVADGKGRYRGADVEVEGLQRASASAAPRRQRTRRRARGASLAPRTGLLITAVFTGVLAALAVFTHLPIIVLPVYVAVSLLAFLVYAFDKAAAMNGRWRTPESSLLLIGLVGGWPGALVAQSLFRHKSSKAPFQASFWLSVLVNCAALAWMCTAAGAAAIRTLLY